MLNATILQKLSSKTLAGMVADLEYDGAEKHSDAIGELLGIGNKNIGELQFADVLYGRRLEYGRDAANKYATGTETRTNRREVCPTCYRPN